MTTKIKFIKIVASKIKTRSKPITIKIKLGRKKNKKGNTEGGTSVQEEDSHEKDNHLHHNTPGIYPPATISGVKSNTEVRTGVQYQPILPLSNQHPDIFFAVRPKKEWCCSATLAQTLL